MQNRMTVISSATGTDWAAERSSRPAPSPNWPLADTSTASTIHAGDIPHWDTNRRYHSWPKWPSQSESLSTKSEQVHIRDGEGLDVIQFIPNRQNTKTVVVTAIDENIEHIHVDATLIKSKTRPGELLEKFTGLIEEIKLKKNYSAEQSEQERSPN
ncbi:hypothetical protein CLV41_10846 [Roseibium marinum]|uniref:Uncharacterized protein n=1 Tax=Roseibium marinum TaxID=281252 RepID=A0A2S3UQ06_9HYPH|nr:hypothetical protein CLV41_10846 [Roseibium marinum]